MSLYPEGEFLLPVFPLPGLVFFPQTRLPLHIFEQRYRQLVQDAMESDRRFGMALLKPGWEEDYEQSPEIHQYGTMGLIENIARLEDGRYNLVLLGVVRYQVLEQVENNPYRIFRVVARPEETIDPMLAYGEREWLVEVCRQFLEQLPGGVQVRELETATLEAVTNALIMSLDILPVEKQRLLELDDLVERAQRVGAELQSRLESLQRFRNPQSRSQS
jgi:uncharacterized protein